MHSEGFPTGTALYESLLENKCVCYDFSYLIGLMKTFFVEYLKATNYTIFILVCRALSLINIRHTYGVPVRDNGLSIKVS